MYNQVLTTIAAVEQVIQTAYSEQDWLVIVLKHSGWADNIYQYSPVMRATVGLVKINDLNIIARLETVDLTPALKKPKITVDFRVPTYSGDYATVESLKYPTAEDIRAVLLRLNAYTGFDIAAPVMAQQ
jgi:hypothetical protein